MIYWIWIICCKIVFHLVVNFIDAHYLYNDDTINVHVSYTDEIKYELKYHFTIHNTYYNLPEAAHVRILVFGKFENHIQHF